MRERVWIAVAMALAVVAMLVVVLATSPTSMMTLRSTTTRMYASRVRATMTTLEELEVSRAPARSETASRGEDEEDVRDDDSDEEEDVKDGDADADSDEEDVKDDDAADADADVSEARDRRRRVEEEGAGDQTENATVDGSSSQSRWTRIVDELLFNATTITALSDGWRALVRKLDARERLSIVGLGTSVMGIHGGCTETAAVLRPTCKAHAKRDTCCGAGLWGSGATWQTQTGEFMRPAIEWLEREYPADVASFGYEPLSEPNATHEWLNVGHPGGGVQGFARCLDKWVPKFEGVDLFVFEFSPAQEFFNEGRLKSPGEAFMHDVETLMRRLTRETQSSANAERNQKMPAFMFVHVTNWCAPFAVNDTKANDDYAIIRQVCRSVPRTKIVRESSVPPVEEMSGEIRRAYLGATPQTDAYLKLGEHYGIPTLDLAAGMFEAMRDTTQDATAPIAMSDWTDDGVHPRGVNATAIVGSYFLNAFRMAIDATRETFKMDARPVASYAPSTFVPDARDSDASRYTSSMFWSNHAPVAVARAADSKQFPPMLTAARVRIVSKCYEWGKEVLERGGPEDIIQTEQTAGFFNWPPIVEESEGWEYIEREERGRTPHKPGYVSTKEGAYVVVRASLGKPNGRVSGVIVRVTALHSWDKHGAFNVSCANGCACERRIDTQWDRQVSITVSADIPVTLDGVDFSSGPRELDFNGTQTCDVRMQVTSEDGKRVKLVGIAVAHEVEME